MKNRRGSTLVMTLLIFVVLMIFGTFILGFMVTENKQSLNHQRKIQAYYIARSGAVAVEEAFKSAIIKMDEVEINNLINSLPLSIDVSDLNSSLNFSEGSIKEVKLAKEDNQLISIKSSGKVSNIEERVEIILESNTENDSSSEIIMENAVFGGSLVNIGHWTRPNINGAITTNAETIIMSDKKFKSGKTRHEDRDYLIETNKKRNYPNHKYNDAFPQSIERIGDINLPQIPSFKIPKLEIYPYNNANFIINEPNQILKNSYKYNKFLIEWNKELVIDASDNDIIVNTNLFENRGEILIKGKNNVTIYAETMNTHNNKKITLDSNYKGTFKVYHVGKKQSSLKINSNIPGDLYVEEASLNTNTNTNISGSLYHMGNTRSSITIMGDVNKDLYFKEASLELNDSCRVGGNIYQLGNNKNTTFLTGELKGSTYVENASVNIHYKKTIEGDIYHFGDNNSKVTFNGSTNGNLYVKEANLFTHGDSIINGNVYHNGKDENEQNGNIKQSIIEIKGKINKAIYLTEGKITIDSNKILGENIYYNGNSLTFENNSVTIMGSVYAPNAKIKINIKINIEGGIISDELIISGYHTNIKGNSKFFIPPILSDDINEKSTFERKYFK